MANPAGPNEPLPAPAETRVRGTMGIMGIMDTLWVIGGRRHHTNYGGEKINALNSLENQ